MKFQYNDGGRAAAGFTGGRAGDCVCRAIAIAEQLSYDDVYYALNKNIQARRQTKKIRGSTARTGVAKKVTRDYLSLLGWEWHPTMSIGSGCKVHLRENELPMGRIIVSLSRHVAAVIDGVLHDAYDCSREGTRCVYGYWSQP